MPMCLVLHTEAYMGKMPDCLKFARNTPGELFPADSAPANIVSVPKTHGTFCKKCGRHQPHQITVQEGQGVCVRRENSVVTGNSVSVVGRLGQFSGKKAKTTKKMVLRLECVVPNCRSKKMLAIKVCKHLELGREKRKGQLI